MIKSSNLNRLGWVDALRAFGIILVIIGHAIGRPQLLEKILYGFHMPLFFLLSGYLFHTDDEKSISDIFKAKFKRYLVPCFALSFVNLIINAGWESLKMDGQELLNSTIRHLYWVMHSGSRSSTTPNCTPLWFLPCLFLSTIYLHIFFRFRQKHRRVCDFAGIAAIAGILYLWKNEVNSLPWHFDVAVLGAALMIVGYNWKKLERRGVPNYALFALFVIGICTIYKNEAVDVNLSRIHNPILFFVGAVATGLACIGFFQRFYTKRIVLLEYIGRHTILILGFEYAMRTLVNYVWERISAFSTIPLTWWLQSLIRLALLVVLMLLWDLLKKRFPKIAIF